MDSTTDLSNLDENALRELLDVAPNYDERCRIRSAIRALKKSGNPTAATTTFSQPRDRNTGGVQRSSTFTSSLSSIKITNNGLPQTLAQPRSTSFTLKDSSHGDSNNGTGIAQRKWGKHIGNNNSQNSAVSLGTNYRSSTTEKANFFRKLENTGQTLPGSHSNTNSSQNERIPKSVQEKTHVGKSTMDNVAPKVSCTSNDDIGQIQDKNQLTNLLRKSTTLDAPVKIRAALRQLRVKENAEAISNTMPSNEEEPEEESQVVYYSTDDTDTRLTSDSITVTLNPDVQPSQSSESRLLERLNSKLKSLEEELTTSKDFDHRRALRSEMRELRAQIRDVKDGKIPPGLEASIAKTSEHDSLLITSVEITMENDNNSRVVLSSQSDSDSQLDTSSPETPTSDRDMKLKFLEPLLDLVAVDGEPATLECLVQAPPGATIKWYKDDKLVPASKDFEQKFKDKTAKFIINEVFPDDQGCYTCAVETPGGRIETTAKVTVQDNENLVMPEFLDLLHDFNATEGSKIILQCAVGGTPPPDVAWYMGRKLLPSNHIYSQSFDGKTAKLVIVDAERGDQGSYKCVIQNKAGEAMCSCRVRVTTTGAKAKNSISEEDEGHRCAVPQIIKGLESKYATVGQEVTLSCEVAGSPQPSVTWYKDDQALPRGLRVSQTYEGSVASLKIKDVRMSDLGEYSCTARNDRGDAGTTTNLMVKAKGVTGSPQKRPPAVYIAPSPGGTGRKMGALEQLAANLKTKIRKEPPRVCDPNKDPYEGYLTTSSEDEDTAMADISKIEDEDLLRKMMNKTDNFDERKKIRMRLRELAEAESAKFQAAKQPRESAVEMRQRLAAAEKERKMNQFAEEAKDGRKESNIMEQELKRKRAEADKAKQEELEKMKEMGKVMAAAHHTGHDISRRAEAKGRAVLEGKSGENEDTVFRSTKTERGPDGRLTTTTSTTTQKTKDGSTTVTKQSKQITQVSGLGGTTYNIKKASASDTAERLAETFSSKAFPGSTGMIKVQTESWNSKDGATKRAEKTQTWGAPGGATSARSAFQQMDKANPGTGTAAGGSQFGGGGKVTVQRSASTVKQMLLDWCKHQTAGYDNVDITNFSSSWNNGMAFCALIHRFYPHAFTYSRLDPKKRRANFKLAFDVAEKYGDIAQLLEVDDMVRMKNPDWKCVFTYIQLFYRKFRDYDPTQEKKEA